MRRIFILQYEGMRTLDYTRMATSFFTVFTVPTPASPDHISSYKTIRLKGLLTNPEAFGSTYVKESKFSPEKWRLRLNTLGRTTLGAAKRGDEVGGEWIGTVSILSPEMLAGDPADRSLYPPKLKKAEDIGVAEVYMLVGMWVHSDYRRVGVGRALIDYAIRIVKSVPPHPVNAGKSGNDKPKNKSKVVLLEVHKSNIAARKLYEKMGFTIQEDNGASGDSEGVELWMAITLD